MSIPYPKPEPVPRLVICGEGEPIDYRLRNFETTVGRYDLNDIRIQDRSVSSCHLKICETEGGRHRIEDLESRNGTTVNGNTIGTCLLEDGDFIVLGRSVSIHYLVFSAAEHEGEIPAPLLVEFKSIHDRILALREQRTALKRRIRLKTAEYEDLLDSIIELKQNPELAFRQIYGEGEVHFPVNFSDRITAPTDFLKETGLALPS